MTKKEFAGMKRGENLLTANQKEVEKVYGKERADIANYGCITGEDYISTKVYEFYRYPRMMLTSYYVGIGKKIEHIHEECQLILSNMEVK